jgi:hypothetical protein
MTIQCAYMQKKWPLFYECGPWSTMIMASVVWFVGSQIYHRGPKATAHDHSFTWANMGITLVLFKDLPVI